MFRSYLLKNYTILNHNSNLTVCKQPYPIFTIKIKDSGKEEKKCLLP